MKPLLIVTTILAAISPLAAASPATVTHAEMRQKDQWVKTYLLEPKFNHAKPQSPPATSAPKPGLGVYANNDPVIPNRRGDSPLKIADKTYSRGLYCHAVSKIFVTLPQPGKHFGAEVGLDNNED